MDKQKLEELKNRFLTTVKSNIKRDGVDGLIEWLEQTDFYIAPASTRYHGIEEGGLLKHSLTVYDELHRIEKAFPEVEIPEESTAIVSLFHDFCKINCYKPEMRWRKNQNQQWEQYQTYMFKEDYAFGGHGSKSVYLVQHFIKLTPEEASAINCHMGAWDQTTYSNPSPVFEQNHLAWMLHVADESADYFHNM